MKSVTPRVETKASKQADRSQEYTKLQNSATENK